MRRSALIFAAALFALAATPLAGAAQDPFAGTWRGVANINGMSCIFERVMTTGARYSETVRCGSIATGQSGVYRVFPNQTIGFEVASWFPTRRYVMDNGFSGHYEPYTRPAGGVFQYRFPTPDTLFFRDVNLGGTITYHRLR